MDVGPRAEAWTKLARAAPLATFLAVLVGCARSHEGAECAPSSCDASSARDAAPPRDSPSPDAPLPDTPAPDVPADAGPLPVGAELLASGTGDVRAVHRVEGSRDLLVVTHRRIYRVFVAEPGRRPAELATPGSFRSSTTFGDRLFFGDDRSITRWTMDLEPAPEWHERTVEAPCISLIAGDGILHCRGERHRYVTYDLATGEELLRWALDRLEAVDCGKVEPSVALPLAGRHAALLASLNRLSAQECVVSFDVPGTVWGTRSALPWFAQGPLAFLGDPVRTMVTGEGTVFDLDPCFEGASSCLTVVGALPDVSDEVPVVAFDVTRNDVLFAVQGARGIARCDPGCEALRLEPDGWGVTASASFTLPGAALWPDVFADDPDGVLVVARYDREVGGRTRWEVHRVPLEPASGP